jgi:hypothetical protein
LIKGSDCMGFLGLTVCFFMFGIVINLLAGQKVAPQFYCCGVPFVFLVVMLAGQGMRLIGR